MRVDESKLAKLKELLITGESAAEYLAAVKKSGAALRFVDKSRCTPHEYREICFEALARDSRAERFVAPEMWAEPAFCLTAVNIAPGTLARVVREAMPKDVYSVICMLAVEQDPSLLGKVDPGKLGKQRYAHVCAMAARYNGFALAWVEQEKINPGGYYRIALAAVRQNGLALYYVNMGLISGSGCKDRIIRAALEENTDALQFAEHPSPVQCLRAVQRHPGALQWIRPEQFCRDDYTEICRAAFSPRPLALLEQTWGTQLQIPFDRKKVQDRRALQWVREDLLDEETYRELCICAAGQSPEAIRFINKKLLYRDALFCREISAFNEEAASYLAGLGIEVHESGGADPPS